VKPWTIKTDGGHGFNATSVEGLFNRLSAAPEKGSVEIWHIKNGGQGWSHPVHVHFEEGQILQRGGVAPPLWEKGARKDMYRIGPLPDSTDSVTLAIRVREFLGTYVEHCHNTQHEDNAMLLRWDSQNPGQVLPIQTPFPSWDGVSYVDTNTTDVPTFKTGKATDFLAQRIAGPVAANDTASTTTGVTVTIPVLANDSCVGVCDPASVTIGIAPANGSAVPNTDGTVTYTPNEGFTGTNGFSYTVRDTTTGTQLSNIATVTVTVSATPARPVAVSDTATTIQNVVVGIDLTGNDSNCPTCTVAIAAAPAHGTVVANFPAAGQVAYTPVAGFTGTDSFTYSASNAGGTSDPASVSVNVTPNPVADIVTITAAKQQVGGRHRMHVHGRVSLINLTFAPSVELFAGAANASHTGCTGVMLATLPVNALGAFDFPVTPQPVAVPQVCVQSANGGVADVAVVAP
ncbi:MAG TPA: Ig-like domain-containing protein, partial [Burkholderiales bacterium]